MKSIASTGDMSPTFTSADRVLGLCRSLIFRQLDKIQTGNITLVEAGQQYRFGRDTESDLSVHIKVSDARVYQQVLSGGTIGAGEAYMLGYWEVDDVVKLVQLMLRNRSGMNNMESRFSWFKKTWSSFLDKSRINSIRGSKRNIVAHYDLSNEFFSLFLDPQMMYSSAIYNEQNDELDSASVHKLRHICERLSLSPEDHLVEIGSGWGGDGNICCSKLWLQSNDHDDFG